VSIWLSIKLFVTFPAMVAEHLPVWSAFGRSWKLTKGAAGMIFVLQLIISFGIGIIMQIAYVPMYFSPLATIGAQSGSPSDVFAAVGPMLIGSGVSSVLMLIIGVLAMCVSPILSAVVYRDRLTKQVS